MKALVVMPFFAVGAINLVIAVRQMQGGEIRGPVKVKRSGSPKLFWSLGLLWVSFSLYICFVTASMAVMAFFS